MNELNKDEAFEIPFYGNTLEECVEGLLKLQKRGENVYVNFNGHKLYSADITMDNAFLEVTGKTKAKFDENQKIIMDGMKPAEKELQDNIDEWIKKGNKFIYKEKSEEWEECVNARANDLYHGRELADALVLMEKLDAGESVEEVMKELDKQDHSFLSYGIIRNIILNFSKRGPEFCENSPYENLTEEQKRIIDNIKKQNEELEKNVEKDLVIDENQVIESFENASKIEPTEDFQDISGKELDEMFENIKTDLEIDEKNKIESFENAPKIEPTEDFEIATESELEEMFNEAKSDKKVSYERIENVANIEKNVATKEVKRKELEEINQEIEELRLQKEEKEKEEKQKDINSIE